MDRVSDRSKGFGFVTFASDDEAQKALMELNGQVKCLVLVFSLVKTVISLGNKTVSFSAIKRPCNICGLR